MEHTRASPVLDRNTFLMPMGQVVECIKAEQLNWCLPAQNGKTNRPTNQLQQPKEHSLFFSVLYVIETVHKEYPPQSAVGMDCHAGGLHVIALKQLKGSPNEIASCQCEIIP